MSCRKIYCCGIIAGIGMQDMRRMEPGFIMDAYAERFKYDIKMAAPLAAQKMGLI